MNSTRAQTPAPGGSTRKPRRIAPKPRKSSEIDILTVEPVSVPSSSVQPVSAPATEIISLPMMDTQPDTSVSPPRMAETASLAAEEEEALGDQFQHLGAKRRRNNIV